MTIDDVRAAAEKAKAFRFKASADCGSIDVCEGDSNTCCRSDCGACLGAQRAVEDIADRIRAAIDELVAVFVDSPHPMKWDHTGIIAHAEAAARIASYFASEPNPVSEFRDAVRKFVEDDK